MIKATIYFIFIFFPIIISAGAPSFEKEKIKNEDIFTIINLADSGLTRDVFSLAIKGLKKLESNGVLKNSSILTIADYSQSSNKKRLYVIDLKNNKLLFNTYVAHGRNTGDEYAKYFSNKEGSSKSSLGFYITKKPIFGSHTGYSLTINGVEKGFNDNAIKREIIIHAATYVTENFIKKYGRLGRSFGCPVLPPDLNKPIIETIKDGSCIFVYSSDNQYLIGSELLN